MKPETIIKNLIRRDIPLEIKLSTICRHCAGCCRLTPLKAQFKRRPFKIKPFKKMFNRTSCEYLLLLDRNKLRFKCNIYNDRPDECKIFYCGGSLPNVPNPVIMYERMLTEREMWRK